jgi:hypothetical protein
MRIRWTCALVFSVVVVVALSPVALAKGWSIYLEKRYHSVGTTTTALAVVELKSRRAASRALRLQNFYAYLRLGDNDRTLVRLGRVELSPRDQLGTDLDARVRFRIPAGTEGHHRLVICRLGCAHLPGAPHPTSIRIVSGSVEAHLNRDVDRLVASAGAELARHNFYTKLWSSSLRQRIIYDARIKDSERSDVLQAQLNEVRGRLAAADREGDSIVLWLLAGVCVAAAGIGAQRARRRRPRFLSVRAIEKR